MRKIVLAAMFAMMFGGAALADEAGDARALDAWCARAMLPASRAICSDPELRRLAIERQHVYDGLRSELDDAGKAKLLGEQNDWVRGYSRDCGVPQDGPPPTLPLAPNIRDCLVTAVGNRIVFLQQESGMLLRHEFDEPIAQRHRDADYYLTSGYMCSAPGPLDPRFPAELREDALKKCVPGIPGNRTPLRIMDTTGDYAFVCMRAGSNQFPFAFLMCSYARLGNLTDANGDAVTAPVISAQFP